MKQSPYFHVLRINVFFFLSSRCRSAYSARPLVVENKMQVQRRTTHLATSNQ